MPGAPFSDGSEIGSRGSEGGTIVRDDEHTNGARITLERDCDIAPWTITCGIYGWFFHTRFFASEEESSAEYDRMADTLSEILQMIPRVDDPAADEKMIVVSEAIQAFVLAYPS